MSGFNMKVTPQLEALTEICREHGKIDVDLYGKYDVKRGLRDINGKGVLADSLRFPISFPVKWWMERLFPVKASCIIGN